MSGGRADELRAGLDIGPPTELAIGRGTAFPLAGWCHHPAGRTLSMEVEVAGARSPVVHHSLPRRAGLGAGARRRRDHAYRSGFVGMRGYPVHRRPGRRR